MAVHKPYVFAVLLEIVVLILMIAGAASPWYYYKVGKDTTTFEFLSWAKSDDTHCTYVEDCISSGLRDMYWLIIAFVTISVTACAARIVVLFLFTFSNLNVPKVRSFVREYFMVVILVPVLMSCGPWAIMISHPNVIKEDVKDADNLPCDFYPPMCDFIGSDFGPHAGWALYIGASALSIVVMIISFVYKPKESHGYSQIYMEY